MLDLLLQLIGKRVRHGFGRFQFVRTLVQLLLEIRFQTRYTFVLRLETLQND